MRKLLKEAVDFGAIAEKAVAIIKGKGHTVIMFTDDGMETSDPEVARRFYVKDPNYMITIDEESGVLRINKNSNVELSEIEGVLKQIRNLARNYMLKSQLQVFGKEIAPKDFAYQAKKLRDQKMSGLSEASLSRMSGSKKTSYQTLESTKIIVRHRKPVDEDIRGSRSRQIKAIFIEHAGERFRFPHNHLAGARAMARHIDEGGEMHDSVAKYIIESVANLKQLMEFVRYSRQNKLINEQSEDIIKIVRENIAAYKSELHRFQGAKSYGTMCEQIASREGSELEEDTAELQDMFTVRKFDEKIGESLPLIKRLVTEKNAWRSMIEESSAEAFIVTSTEGLIEAGLVEFDSPIQQLGYKIRALSERVLDETDLSKFVAKIGNKLIEGDELNTFEKSVARNVLENVEVAEEDDCEEDGFTDKLEEVSSEYEAKVTDLADPVFEDDAKKTACSGCNGTGRAPGESDSQYDRKMFSAVSCKACNGYGYGLSGDPARSLSKVKEDEGETCIRCRKGTMELGDTMMGPAKACNRCGYQVQVNEGDEHWEPSSTHNFSDCECCDGTGNMGDMECGECAGSGIITTRVEEGDDDDVDYDGPEFDNLRRLLSRDPNKGPSCKTCMGSGVIPARYTGSKDFGGKYQGVKDFWDCPDCDRTGELSESELKELRKAAGIEIVESDAKKASSGKVDPEDFMDDCPACEGTGNEFGEGGGGDCEKCDGNGYV